MDEPSDNAGSVSFDTGLTEAACGSSATWGKNAIPSTAIVHTPKATMLRNRRRSLMVGLMIGFWQDTSQCGRCGGSTGV